MLEILDTRVVSIRLFLSFPSQASHDAIVAGSHAANAPDSGSCKVSAAGDQDVTNRFRRAGKEKERVWWDDPRSGEPDSMHRR
ncbi:hypothetical protein Axi01nite_17860 [Actinoplanes xinjiangensis]|nr:hypothetical protein Axi01nite_17860 [Actinoplanes xinjiangensis]